MQDLTILSSAATILAHPIIYILLGLLQSLLTSLHTYTLAFLHSFPHSEHYPFQI